MKYAATFALLLLTACGGDERFIASPQVTPTERVSSRFASVELREVSLPEYAAREEIYVETAEGSLTASDLFWADNPTRAVTLALSRNLAEITRVPVAPEPWPFDATPDGRVDVRVERFLRAPDGSLVLTGQYFVADMAGRGRDKARLFTLSEPLPDGAPPAVAATARARLVAALAVRIAKDGL
ncbi:MAG: PqiC family protein [Silicimonas sp.]|nr:PqiC family protein [Silicimonas sp.]NND42559.1 membrane integrity-associated transporter subunit PqiC [Silicimonas sp.]